MTSISVIEVNGHIIDSLTLPKIMDTILDMNAGYHIEEIKIGNKREESSYARLAISSDDEETMSKILEKVTKQGATLLVEQNVTLKESFKDQTMPDDFYSTTNMKTDILLDGEWITVKDTAMDCGIVVSTEKKEAKCLKLSQIKKEDKIVVGYKGIRVHPIKKQKEEQAFSFMGSEVSSEKPKALIIKKIAKRMVEIKKNNEGKILFVLGPAVVHTKSREAFSKLIEMGFVDYMFAGNALATHDIEAALYGTSLGISLEDGSPITGGHSHHLRAINKVNQYGSIKEAVESGAVSNGIMHTCIKNNVDFVLAGSIRDDGPLPEVIRNAVEAQCEMKKRINKDVQMTIMVASMLHSIAVGNLLPAYVETICVDINPAVVTKLADRGSFQSIGLVTDIEAFMRDLAEYVAEEIKNV
jgi:lysine-ketoglutarate reductase/saccharopine dehydrogenase-like protein (TIGR00300 family)